MPSEVRKKNKEISFYIKKNWKAKTSVSQAKKANIVWNSMERSNNTTEMYLLDLAR